MIKKTQKTTPAAPKAVPLNRRNARTRAPLAAVSTASDRRSSLAPPVEAPTPLAPPADTAITPARTRAKRPAVAPRRRVVSAAPASLSHVILPTPAIEAPALPAIIAAHAPAAPEPTHDEVSRRAYYIYLDRVGTSGNPEQDWAAALSELRKERRLSLQWPQD